MLAIEFGSRGRGDSDVFSDRDILLLGRDWGEINKKKEIFSKFGFSASCFNFDRARYLAKNGSLFFKHILDEGVVIIGDMAEFNNLKKIWKYKNSYDDEILENIDLLEILSYLPKNKYAILVGIDILINSIRNVLIRKLTSYGYFVFSWDKIFARAAEIGLIKYYHIPTLRLARKIKNKYRNGDLAINADDVFRDLIIISRLCIDQNLEVKLSDSTALSLPDKFDDGSYKQLRAIEILCAAYEFNKNLSKYIEAVKSPNYFCSAGPNKALHRTEVQEWSTQGPLLDSIAYRRR